MKKTLNQIITFLLLTSLLTGCVGKEAVKTIFQQRTPYEAYAHKLHETKLDNSALGRAWLQAGEQALLDSVLIALPFKETGYFKAEKPAAASYTFKARRGEMIEVNVSTRTKQKISVFLDLYQKETGTTTHLQAADTTNLFLQETVTEDAIFLVRLQPELLQSSSYTITIVAKPSLGFPVLGKNASSVQSFWGADRDGGARKHEGVDIFAPKGTPAIASTKGIISRVNETPLGGKVVWLTDVQNRQSLYYAHLDQQLVQPGQEVNPGDTLGLVGNTGNARTTPPHLHFGIYSYGYGAIDPYPFIYESPVKPAAVNVNEDFLGAWGRTSKQTATIRKSPDSKATALEKLPKHTPLQVIAGIANWYKVQLPGGPVGYLHKNDLESIQKPLQTKALKQETEVMEHPVADASPIALLKKDTQVAVMGAYRMFQLVKLADGTFGWLLKG